MKSNKRQRKCPFSPLTLLAALLLIGGMLAAVLPVLQWDAEVSAEASEYDQLREQNRQAEARETVEEETLNQHVVPPISLIEEGLSVQQSEKRSRRTGGAVRGGLVRISGAKSRLYRVAADSGDERGLSRRADG